MRPGSVQHRPSSVYHDSGTPMRGLHDSGSPMRGEYQRPGSSQYPQYPSSPSRQYPPSSPLREQQQPFQQQSDFTTPAPASPSKHFPVNTVHTSSHQSTRPLDRPTHVRRAASESTMTTPAPSSYSEPSKSSDPGDESDHVKLIPSMSDKPTGLTADDFLPNKFGKMSVSNSSPFGWQQTKLSELDVTSSILRGHSNMMTVLTARSRHITIIRQMWTGKDAKTAAEHAVSCNDESVIVDLLSVIVLRPSIWNLDLCNILLPSIGQLLLSKYESYVNNSAAALKLILKNFATVIKSNIDAPGSTVGVDISKEERANKCMDSYRELVKIRAGILKRQNIPGKPGHAYRELAILMQYLD